MKINRNGSAAWSGGLKDGKGTISTQSGALDAYPYGFATRFEGDGFAVTASHLTLKATIPGTDDATFQELAGKAKANCPISKLLKAEISLDAELLN